MFPGPSSNYLVDTTQPTANSITAGVPAVTGMSLSAVAVIILVALGD